MPRLRCHTGAANGIAGNGGSDTASNLFHPAMYQCKVDLLHLAVVKLLRQRLMRRVGARYNQHAAGFFVQAVDNARPQLAVD